MGARIPAMTRSRAVPEKKAIWFCDIGSMWQSKLSDRRRGRAPAATVAHEIPRTVRLPSGAAVSRCSALRRHLCGHTLSRRLALRKSKTNPMIAQRKPNPSARPKAGGNSVSEWSRKRVTTPAVVNTNAKPMQVSGPDVTAVPLQGIRRRGTKTSTTENTPIRTKMMPNMMSMVFRVEPPNFWISQIVWVDTNCVIQLHHILNCFLQSAKNPCTLRTCSIASVFHPDQTSNGECGRRMSRRARLPQHRCSSHYYHRNCCIPCRDPRRGRRTFW